MPSPGSRRRERVATRSAPVLGGCLTYLAFLVTLIVLSAASGAAGFAILVGLEFDRGPALVISIAVGIGVALGLNWLFRRRLGHSITDFLDLLDLF